MLPNEPAHRLVAVWAKKECGSPLHIQKRRPPQHRPTIQPLVAQGCDKNLSFIVDNVLSVAIMSGMEGTHTNPSIVELDAELARDIAETRAHGYATTGTYRRACACIGCSKQTVTDLDDIDAEPRHYCGDCDACEGRTYCLSADGCVECGDAEATTTTVYGDRVCGGCKTAEMRRAYPRLVRSEVAS